MINPKNDPTELATPFLTDFNEIDSTDTVSGLVSIAWEGDTDPAVDDPVLLYDDGQHEAWGTVTQVDGDLVSARLDWSTWGPAGRYREVADRGRDTSARRMTHAFPETNNTPTGARR